MREQAEFKDLISIIIPVYNVAPFVERCLNSVIAQHYTKLEIIVINDGSKDNTGEIIEKFSKEDSRIKLFTQSNRGVSFARNKGLEVANGKYVAFIDGDDWVSSDYISKMYDEMKSSESDIVKCGCEFVNLYSKKKRVYHSKNRILNNKEALEQYLSGKGISSSVCGGLYKKNLFSGDIRFDSNVKIGEDSQITLRLLSRANKVCIISSVLYYIRVRMGSASRSDILVSDECTVLDDIDFPNRLDNKYKDAYKLRVATSLLIKNSFSISMQNYMNLRNELNYKQLNKYSVRKKLSFKWRLFSLLGKNKYSFILLGRVLNSIGLKPVF